MFDQICNNQLDRQRKREKKIEIPWGRYWAAFTMAVLKKNMRKNTRFVKKVLPQLNFFLELEYAFQ
jgi:hypothetical protein